VHGSNAVEAIEQVLGFFSWHERTQVQVQLANTLLALLGQQLLTRRDGQGRVLVTELLITTPAVRRAIREGELFRLNTFMESGRSLGMHTMADSLVRFTTEGLIDYGAALDVAQSDTELFLSLLRRRLADKRSPGRGGYLVGRAMPAEVRTYRGSYVLPAGTPTRTYRASLTPESEPYWQANGLLALDRGVLRYEPDPYFPAPHLQLSDYAIWLGQRPAFQVTNHVRLICRAAPYQRPAEPAEAVPTRCRISVLLIDFENNRYAVPPEGTEPLELPVDGAWHTFYLPIPGELHGLWVKSYALRITPPEITFELRDLLFS